VRDAAPAPKRKIEETGMPDRAVAVASGGNADYSIPRIILASAVGTMIEWYDFYIFGSLATVLALKFYPPGK
jgi:hypothetical protein